MIAIPAIRSRLVDEVPSASEWRDSARIRIKRGLIDDQEIESSRLRSEIGLASSHWADSEGGKASLKLREIVCVARPNQADELVGRMMLLVSSGASTTSLIIAGSAVAVSAWLLYSQSYTPLLTTTTVAFAFTCAGWAQRVIGRRLAEALRRHEDGAD